MRCPPAASSTPSPTSPNAIATPRRCASERWIRLITDQVPALIAYLSDELVYEFTNKVYEEWYRWPSGSMLGRCLRDVHGAEHCRRLEPYFERALAGESVTFEIAETALSGEERYMQRPTCRTARPTAGSPGCSC